MTPYMTIASHDAFYPVLPEKTGKPHQPKLPNRGGLHPTTKVETVRGWQSAASILPGETVVTSSGDHVQVLDVVHRTNDVTDFLSCNENGPIYIPAYAIGNLTPMTVHGDQTIHLPLKLNFQPCAMDPANVRARDLIGFNEIRQIDSEHLDFCIELVFEDDTILSCGHGGAAYFSGEPQPARMCA